MIILTIAKTYPNHVDQQQSNSKTSCSSSIIHPAQIHLLLLLLLLPPGGDANPATSSLMMQMMKWIILISFPLRIHLSLNQTDQMRRLQYQQSCPSHLSSSHLLVEAPHQRRPANHVTPLRPPYGGTLTMVPRTVMPVV